MLDRGGLFALSYSSSLAPRSAGLGDESRVCEADKTLISSVYLLASSASCLAS